jgi:uncharacterized repeat protein (TIGR03803 family)
MKAAVSLRILACSFVALLLVSKNLHAQSGYTFKHLRSFSGANGLGPEAALIEGSDGNFYGTTSGEYGYTDAQPNAATNGTVFRVTPEGKVTTLHVFAGENGSHPEAPLVQMPNGLLYGSTSGGFSGFPTIFRIATNGTGFTTLVHGSVVEGQTNITLVAGNDGNLYGTDRQGGTIADGCIFRLTPEGVPTIIYSFRGSPDGEFPNGPLYQGTDGKFYGTTGGGGPQLQGTIFRISPAGAYESLYSLSGADGSGPNGLVQAADGNLYGACRQGGNPNYPPSGTVFRVTTEGKFTKLLDLGYGFGEFPPRSVDPQSNLIVGPDGALYGTGVQGGETGTANGGVYRVGLDGSYNAVYAFDGTNGSGPFGSLLLAGDGSFYGTTSGYIAQTDALNGGDQDGTIFKLTPKSAKTMEPTVTLVPAIPTVQAGSGEAGAVAVYLSPAQSSKVAVDYMAAGTARNGQNYARLTGKLEFKAGDTRASIKIMPIGDLGGAVSKVVKIKLLPGNGYKIGAPTTIKVRITGAN